MALRRAAMPPVLRVHAIRVHLARVEPPALVAVAAVAALVTLVALAARALVAVTVTVGVGVGVGVGVTVVCAGGRVRVIALEHRAGYRADQRLGRTLPRVGLVR